MKFNKIIHCFLIFLMILQSLVYPWISILPAPPRANAQESPPSEATNSAQTPAPSPLATQLDLDTIFPSTNSAQPTPPEVIPEATISATPEVIPEDDISTPSAEVASPSASPSSTPSALPSPSPSPSPSSDPISPIPNLHIESDSSREMPPDAQQSGRPTPSRAAIDPSIVIPSSLVSEIVDPFAINLSYPFVGAFTITYGFGVHSQSDYISRMQSLFGVVGHDGIDFATPYGTQILATDQGSVISTGTGLYGTTIQIQHSWGISYYGHLSESNVNVGDKLVRGQILGLSGNSGITTGPHLHFGIRPNNPVMENGFHGMINPLSYFNKSSVLGISNITTSLIPRVKKLSKFTLAKKSLSTTDSDLKITFTTPPNQDLTISLINPKGVETDITQNVLGASAGPVAPSEIIDLTALSLTEIGKYTLTITDTNGNYDQQDFSWGVLAINTNKASYLIGDTANFAIAVLDDRGDMVCDAQVELVVEDPSGVNTTLSTIDNSIVSNVNVCQSHDYTITPDYQSSYTLNQLGKYNLTLTATTQSGIRSIVDSFEVNNSNPFDVERITATRLFPPHDYPVTLKVIANQNYVGFVQDKLPSNFIIRHSDTSSFTIRDEADYQIVEWPVNWKAGNEYELSYDFKAPEVSPDFYLIGPLTIGTWQESREWQLAIDAITYQSASSIDSNIKTTKDLVQTASPVYPNGIVAGDLLVLMIGMKPIVANGGSVTTPTGWTSITSLVGAGGYGSTLTTATGNTNIFGFYKIATGTESQERLNVTLNDNDGSWAQVYRLSGTLGSWDVAGATGSDVTGDTTVSITMGTDPGVTAGDYIIGGMTNPTAVGAGAQYSAEALTQTGITFGTVTEIAETSSGALTLDFGGVTYRASVSSGTSSAAPVFTATAGGTVTNVRGPGIFIRAREVAAPSVPTMYPDDGGTNQIVFANSRFNDTTPIVRAAATHTTTFDRFQVEFNTASDWSGTAYTETFSSTYSSATQYNLQTTGTLALPSTNNATYYVRTRASADAGSHYGVWSTTLWPYTYSTNSTSWLQTTDSQLNSGTLTSTRDSGSGSLKLPITPSVKNFTSTTTEIEANSITLTKPDGVATNDLLLIFVGNDDNTATDQWDNTTYKPTGFTLINEAGDGTGDAHTAAFYRIADGSEASTISVSAQSSRDYWGYYVRVVGASTSSPINATGADSTSDGTNELVITEVTTTLDNSLAFYIHAFDGGDGAPFMVREQGWSKNSEIYPTGGTSGGDTSSVAGSWGTMVKTIAGATGTATVASGDGTLANAVTDGYGGFTFAIAPLSPSSGTVMSTEVDYDWADNATSWKEIDFSTIETNGDIKVKVYYTATTACDTIIPDVDLASNSTGFDISANPINISSLNTTTYNKICLQATLTNSRGTPYLENWSVTWSYATATTSIAGTANGNDAATVKVAVNGTTQAQSTTIASSAWTITGVSVAPDDIVTVWVDGVADSLETTAVTRQGTGNITGMVLNTNVTTIGSNQNTELIINKLNLFDCTDDEDVMYQASGSHLKVEGDSCAGPTTNSYTAEKINVLASNTLSVNSVETLTTYDLSFAGLLTSVGSVTFNVSHDWANTGTFTQSTSTVNLTGANSSTQTLSGSSNFYNLSASTSSNSLGRTIRFTAGTTQTVTGTWTVTGFTGKLITLESSTSSIWTIAPTISSITYASVSYSTNAGSSICASYSSDTGHNTSWSISAYNNCRVRQVGSTTDTTTTTGSNYTQMNNMAITPGAGDYMVNFNTSIQKNLSTSHQFVTLYVAGVQVAHTERFIEGDSSYDLGDMAVNPVSIQASVTGVGANDVIEIRWRTDSGTPIAHERTLTVQSVLSSDMTQATAVDSPVTASSTDVLLTDMTLTPGAGDYLIYFSSSVENSTVSASTYASIYVAGSQVAHSERKLFTESAITNTTIPISTQAYVSSVGASDAIEIKWRTDIGIATMMQRTLTVQKVTSTNMTQATATSDTTTTSTSDTQMASMTLTPGAGNYIAYFSTSIKNTRIATTGATMNLSLYAGSAQASHSERQVYVEDSFGSGDIDSFPTSTVAYLTNVGAADVIEIKYRTTGGTMTAHQRTLTLQKIVANDRDALDPVVGFFSPPATWTSVGDANISLATPDPQNGDLLIAAVSVRPSSVTLSAPGSWTLLDSRTGTDGGSEGADTGSVGMYFFTKTATGSEGTGTVTFTKSGTASVITGQIMLARSSTGTYSVAASGYSINADATNWNGTLGSDIGLSQGDVVILATAQNGDLSNTSAWNITATDINTKSTVNEQGEYASTTGDDVEVGIASTQIWDGSGTSTPTLTVTQSAAASGVVVAIRIRQGIGTARSDTWIRSVSKPVPGSTSVVMAYPDHDPGDLLVAIVGSRGSTDPTPTALAGWTQINTINGGSGAYGADAGNSRTTAFYIFAEDRAIGTPTITVTSGDTSIGQIISVHRDNAGSWDIDSDGSSDTTAGTSWSATGSGIDLASSNNGDLVLTASTPNTDAYTYNTYGLTASGVTFDSVREVNQFVSSQGNDMGYTLSYAKVTAGSGTGVAPTATMTASGTAGSAPTGSSLIFKIRGVDQTDPTPTVGILNPPSISNWLSAGDANLALPQPNPYNGDLMIASLAIRPSASTVNTPGGWTLLDSRTGTDGAAEGADTGSVGLYTFYKVADGTEGVANVTFTESGTTSVWAGSIFKVRSATGTYSLASGGYSKNGDTADWSGTLDSDIGMAPGDIILQIAAQNGDVANTSGWNLQAPGVIFKGTTFEHSEYANTSGNDIEIDFASTQIWEGTNTSTPTNILTLNAAASGTYAAIRIREGSGSASTKTWVRSSSTQVSGTTSLTFNVPDHDVGDLMILTIGSRGSGDPTVTTPTGWTSMASYNGGSGSFGVDTGPARSTAFYQELKQRQFSTLTVSVPSGDTSIGQISVVHRDNLASWAIDSDGGTDVTGGSVSWSAVGSGIDLASTYGGDLILVASSINTDANNTYSSHALSASGITFETLKSNSVVRSSNGNDMTYELVTSRVTAGSGSGVAPTFTFTSSGYQTDSPTGASLILKIVGIPSTTTISISGTANGNNAATVKVAYNTAIQGQTAIIGSGTWSITGAAEPSVGAVITVWVDSVSDANETTAITKYNTGSSVSGMVLDTNVLTIGSNQDQSLSVTNLNQYDCTENEDIMHQASSSHIKVEGDSCAGSSTNTYSSEEIEILSGDILTVGAETVTTYDMTITGTLTSSGNSTYNIAHNWNKTGTFTSSTSTVNLTGGSATTQTLSGTTSFYNLSATGSSARTVKFPSSVTTTITGTLTLTGASGQNLTLDPGTAATVWTINPTAAAVSYASISYSTNIGVAFCASSSIDSGNNTGWSISSGSTCQNSSYSFERKTWYDGTRYWRSFHDVSDGRIEFEYSTDGTSWTEDTSARIATSTSDFSIQADSSDAYVAYKTQDVSSTDNLVTGNLEGHWKMNESSWNGTTDEVVDSSANAKHGTAVGNATTTASGKFSRAGSLDGTGDYVNMGDQAAHDLSLPLSLSAWIYMTELPSSKGSEAVIISKGGSASAWQYLFSIDTSDYLFFFKENSGCATGEYSTLYQFDSGDVNVWRHVAVTVSAGGDTKLYVDGTEVSTDTLADSTMCTSGALNFRVGALSDGSRNFKGNIDDARIYSTDISPTQVGILANPGYDIEVRKAVSYPGTGFTWGTESIALNGSSSTSNYQYPTITQDSNSKLWVGASKNVSGTYTYNALRSTSASTITAWDTSTSLDSSANSNKYGTLAPGLSGAVYASWIDSTTIEGKYYNGTSWEGSPTTIATGTTGLTTTLSMVGDSNGYFHLLYIDSNGYTMYRKYISSWGIPATLDANAGNTYPTLTLNSTDGDLYAFWIRSNNIYYKKGDFLSGGNALLFDGTADYVNVPYNASLDYANTLTVEFWFTPGVTIDTSLSTYKGILSKAYSNTDSENDWVFFWESTEAGKLRFGTYGDNVKTTNDTWTAGVWYHMAVTVDGSNNAYIYVNGVQDNYGGDTSVNGNPINGSQNTPFNIGLAKVASGDQYFDGKIDDVRIYNAARSAAQIKSDMQSELAGNETNLQAYWKMNAGSGQTVADSTSNAYDGTLGATSGSASDDPSWSSTIPFSNSWDQANTTWKSTGNNTNITSNYSGAGKVFGEWIDGSTINWDKLTLNVAPNSPTSLAQKTTGDVTIATGGWTNTTSVKFTATATDTDNPDTLYLCVEKDLLGTSFSNTEDSCGSGVAYSGSGVSVTHTITSQTDASEYHWQARTKDASGTYSAWVSYDANAESARDYGLDTTSPTSGTVYDGTSAGVDVIFSDTSLSVLSANWDSFNLNVSGLNKYEYSIGTSIGGVDIKAWTDNTTSTSVTATGLTLQSSKIYYVNVRATDNAGNVGSVISSNGQLVAPSISFTITPASLTFNPLNLSNSYTDTQNTTLTTSTNAYNGYVVRAFVTDYLRSTDTLTTIADFSAGSYATPSTWAGAETGFGYTSSDITIGGSDKFGSGTLYAPFSQTGPGDIVADHTNTVSGTPVSNEVFTITYKVKTPSTQASKNYSTTAIYTATAQY